MTVHATYTAKRLLFKADLIEPLEMHEVFEIVTPSAIWRMKKSDFYRVFPNVVSSKSYQKEKRYYHYPKAPEKANEFRIEK